MFPLFPENGQSIPLFLCGKKTFKKCNPSKFYLSKLTKKTASKLTLHHMGNIFISELI